MNNEFTPKEKSILDLLARGKWIRMHDGRCGDGFVDMDALKGLVDKGVVEKFDNKGVPFVRAIAIPKIPRPQIVRDAHLKYLDGLRQSGQVNMFGARPYLMDDFDLSKSDAATILTYWMASFGERHPSKEQ